MYPTKVKALLALQTIWRLVAWFFVPFILLTAKPVKHQESDVIRRELPNWLKWASTPDYHLPGDFDEPAVKRIYNFLFQFSERVAWFVTSWYWIGFRNVGHGILWNSGHPTPMHPQHLTSAELDEYKTRIHQRKVGPLWVMWGYKTVEDRLHTLGIRLPADWYWAVPWYSIRFKKRDLGGNG